MQKGAHHANFLPSHHFVRAKTHVSWAKTHVSWATTHVSWAKTHVSWPKTHVSWAKTHVCRPATHVSWPKQNDRDRKIRKFFGLRRQKVKVRGSPETRFGQVSGQSEPSSGGKRTVKVWENFEKKLFSPSKNETSGIT